MDDSFTFFERINLFINKYSPILVLLTLLGTIAGGGAYLLSIKNQIEYNNTLIDKYYDEMKSQRDIIISFKDDFHTKHEDLIKQTSKSSAYIDSLHQKLNDIHDRLKTIETRVYDLSTK